MKILAGTERILWLIEPLGVNVTRSGLFMGEMHRELDGFALDNDESSLELAMPVTVKSMGPS